MMLDPLHRPHYDIITAMRGPDGEAPYNIKTLTTAVIRWFVFEADPDADWCDVTSPETAGSYWLFNPTSKFAAEAADDLVRLRIWWAGNVHFETHITNAFVALGKNNPAAAEYWTWLQSVLAP